MTDIDTSKLSWDAWDELQNPPPAETDFDRVVETAISRRGFLGGVLAFGSAAAAMGTLGNLMTSTSAEAQEAAAGRFPFKPVAAATDHTIHVPEGYSWKPVAKWGSRFSPTFPISITPKLSALKIRTRSSAKTPTAWNCSWSAATS
jgi:secreted PhoX family phosphatase